MKLSRISFYTKGFHFSRAGLRPPPFSHKKIGLIDISINSAKSPICLESLKTLSHPDRRIEQLMQDPKNSLLAHKYQSFLHQRGAITLGATLRKGSFAEIISASVQPNAPFFGGKSSAKEVVIKVVSKEIADENPKGHFLSKERKGGEKLWL